MAAVFSKRNSRRDFKRGSAVTGWAILSKPATQTLYLASMQKAERKKVSFKTAGAELRSDIPKARKLSLVEKEGTARRVAKNSSLPAKTYERLGEAEK